MSKQATRCLLMLLILAASGVAQEPTFRGQRVEMDFTAGQEPSYPAQALFYHAPVSLQPVVYRTVWMFENAPTEAPIRLAAKEWAFLWVNGECVVDLVGRGRDRRPASLPIEVDLAPYLRAGANVIAVSAGAEGFALAGLARVDGRVVPLESAPEPWRVWTFPPHTRLEAQPFLTSVSLEGLPHAAVRIGAAEGVECTPEQARRIVARDRRRHLAAVLEDVRYEAQLLHKRGVAIVEDRTHLWGGPATVPPTALAAARQVALDAAGESLRPEQILELRARLDAAGQLIVQADRLTFARLAGEVLQGGPFVAERQQALLEAAAGMLEKGDAPAALAKLAELRDAMDAVEMQIAHRQGAPVNRLNRAIANKAGWTDDPTLLDSEPARWGVRFNPIETSWFMDLAGPWRFKLDPKNTGLEQRVHEFGYNIDNQWPELNVPGYWEKQGAQFQVNNPDALAQAPYPGVNTRTDGPYNGYAWYRKKVLVPAEWAGYDLELYMEAVDDYDWAYWNGQEIGHTGADTNPEDFWRAARHYRIPKEQVTFGGYNVIAVRVYDCGAGGGILGCMQLRCPGLQADYESRPAVSREPTRVYANPLSPAAVLAVGEKELDVFGWDFRASAGPDGLLLHLAGQEVYRPFAQGETLVYDADRDGPLTGNWVLLWSRPGREDGDLPIQLVLLQAPRAIRARRAPTGTQRITVEFDGEDARVLALRPVRTDSGAREATDPAVLSACRFWSAAALAQPVRYAELARLAPDRRDVLEVTDVYDYHVFRDFLGTDAVKLAPLPPLACYGLSVQARGVSAGEGVQPVDLSLGQYGRFHAVVGGSAVRYTVPVDTLPRLGGFTSFCFSGRDVGVPGNRPEIEHIAATGSNTWRPQSNDRGEKIMNTTRWCNEAGLNMLFNIDNGLGARPEAVEHWVQIARQCRDLPAWAVAYDLINEPANMPPEVYNPQIKRIVEALREVDPVHMIYVETPHSFASIDQFVNLQPVDDKAVVYAFHDYDYRLPARWPKTDTDIRNMQHQWLPAMRFALKHDAPIAISEYGGFEQGGDPWNNRSAMVLLSDFFEVFDQFGFHHQYYSNRGVTQSRPDGSIRESYVQKGYRRLFAGDTFYRFRENWQAGLKK